MPSLLHESILGLLEDHPVLLRELAPLAGLGREHLRGRLRLGPTGLQSVLPPERQADLVLLVERSAGTQLVMAVEVQGGVDPEKSLVWPYMTAALRLKHRCDAVVLVIALSGEVERWAGAGFALSPVQHMRPLVVGPSRVEPVVDPQVARRNPHRALLSALVHLRGPAAAAVGEAALLGLVAVDPAARSRYEDIVLHLLGPLARPIMEKLMRSHYEFRSELARERFAEGLSQGLEQGIEKGIEKGKRAMAADLARLRYGEAAVPLLPLIAAADQSTLGSLAEGILQGRPVEEIIEAWTARLPTVADT